MPTDCKAWPVARTNNWFDTIRASGALVRRFFVWRSVSSAARKKCCTLRFHAADASRERFVPNLESFFFVSGIT